MKLLFILPILLTLHLGAQTDPELYYDPDTTRTELSVEEPAELPRWEWTLAFSGMVPQHVFKLNSTRNFYFGANTGFQVHLKNSPLVLGSTVGFYHFGTATLEYDGPIGDEFGPIREQSSSFTVHLQFYTRYLLPYWKNFQPYADVFVQPSFYFLTNSFEDVEFDDTIDSGVEDSGSTLGFGGAAGLLIYFPRANMLQLNLRCAYLRSTPGEYFVYDGEFTSSTLDGFTSESSQMSAIVPEIGLIVPIW